MSERDLPMMPFFVKDWIAATVHWTDAERGAYASLLFHQWVNGCIPADEKQLGRIMGTPESQFEDRWSTIGPKFDGDTEGLFNNRLEEVRKKAISLRDAKVRGAEGANAVRRAKKTQRLEAANAQRTESVDSASRETDASATHTSTSTSTYSEEEDKTENPEQRSAFAARVSRGSYWSDEKWIDFKMRYPTRSGGYDWEGGKKAWRARMREGHTWEQLFAGVERYAAYCQAAGKVGTEYVLNVKTFCGPSKRFLEDWELPADATRDAAWSPPIDDPPEDP